MLVYYSTKKNFLSDVRQNIIVDILDGFFRSKGIGVARAELAAWSNSLNHFVNVVAASGIDDQVEVAVEYQIPQTSKRIDVILVGRSEKEDRNCLLIVELKQWDQVEFSDKNDLIKTWIGNALREVPHPSYQAASYASLLINFNSFIESSGLRVQSCAYLHNYRQKGILRDKRYKYWLDISPIFFASDFSKFAQFIRKYVKNQSTHSKIINQIENAPLRPSKKLADLFASIVSGNPEFFLVDDQKVIFETVMEQLKSQDASKISKKKVIIIKGGPGTGKSLVAINLLSSALKLGLQARYVSKNSAPREVYLKKIQDSSTAKKRLSVSSVKHLFVSSGRFYDQEKNSFDLLLVDEAHRLNEKSGLYGNLGENQIKEIVRASKLSVFFIDEFQRVTLRDIGSVEAIKHYAKSLNASVEERELVSQFRCAGSDNYLAWLDSALQLGEQADIKLDSEIFELRVFDSPGKLFKALDELNKKNFLARMVAGYCWDWKSKQDPNAFDIIIGDFKRQWNLNKYGAAWLAYPESKSEVGCIHTVQGLEVDYIGVIIGPDLYLDKEGRVRGDFTKRSPMDASLRGARKMIGQAKSKVEKNAITKQLETIIKSTYRVLMTRGMKGCYIYCCDERLGEYFKKQIK